MRGRPRPIRAFEILEDRCLLSTTSFAVIGDYGTNSTGEAQVSNLVHSWNPDFIATLGDNNYPNGSAATIDTNIGQYYHDYIGNYTGAYGAGSALNRFFPALGNHDWQTRSGSPALPTPYLNYFSLPGNERYYSYTQGPIEFFVIDSGDASNTGSDSFDPDGYTSSSYQAQWLKASLAASLTPWQVVYFHHPPFSSGGHGNTPVMQWPFQLWGADAILSGHEHTYERFDVGGLPYIVNGLGGAGLTPIGTTVGGSQAHFTGDYGALRGTANDTTLQLQMVTVTGSIVDTLVLDKSTSPPTVNVAATDPTAAEQSSDPGMFTITRSGSLTNPLTVNYLVNGTATAGSDFQLLPISVIIPAGQASVNVQVQPLDDAMAEGPESVSLRLTPSTMYSLGPAKSATLTIADNDSIYAYLVSPTATWSYLDNGTNPGTAWRDANYDDSAWRSGQGEFGYGDDDESTFIAFGPTAASKYVTTYFRTHFSVGDPSALNDLQLRLLRDDGAVIYLNGVEVYRNNLPLGTVSSTTLATSSLGLPEEAAWITAILPRAALVAGNNTLAVEIHQAEIVSTDLSFNLELIGNHAVPGTARIGGVSYLDVNASGTKDPGERGVGGFTVFLDVNKNGLFDISEPSRVTDANGAYEFYDLVPGNYTLSDVLFGATRLTTGAGNVTVNLVAGADQLAVDLGHRFASPIFATRTTSNLFSAKYPNSNTAYVYNVFRSLLSHDPSASEVAYHVNALNGGYNRIDYATSIYFRDEQLAFQVDQIYRTFLRHPADDAGKAFWSDQIRRGLSPEWIIGLLVTANEYQMSHVSNAAYIQGIYNDLMGRQATAMDVTFWSNYLNTHSRFDLAYNFATLPEAYTRAVKDIFVQFLHREASAIDVNHWVNLLVTRQITVARLAILLLASSEFAIRANNGTG